MRFGDALILKVLSLSVFCWLSNYWLSWCCRGVGVGVVFGRISFSYCTSNPNYKDELFRFAILGFALN